MIARLLKIIHSELTPFKVRAIGKERLSYCLLTIQLERRLCITIGSFVRLYAVVKELRGLEF